MKNLLALAALVLLALPAWAQLEVELRFDQEQFLPGESVPLKVRISNVSGQVVQFGGNDDWLTFRIETDQHRFVRQLEKPPVRAPFQLQNATIGTKLVNLGPCFSFDRPGRYFVTASMKVSPWEQDWTSKPIGFNIVPGSKIWEADFGVPRGGAQPEMRRYALIQSNHRKELKLYFRLTDPSEARIFAIYPLGGLISFSKPEAQIDRAGNLHVLYQNGARSFLFTQMDNEGKMLKRQIFEYAGTRPVLTTDPDGNLLVAGGARRLTADDLPPNPPEDLLAPEPTPAPAPVPPAVAPK
ncbi:MAG: hypothetical protein HY301_15770 [Verrucomicrobia bacterium]|nr:hypothetical protein [Verrucomicrobiota bacterium]